MDLSPMLSKVPEFEGTPPLYYLLTWFWAQAFGTGEVGLRLLPALLSIGTVVVTYLAGTTLAGRRAGVIAAGLVALNPLAVWYAQEARAYALLIFLTTLALWFFARLLRGEGSRSWNLVGWSLASAAALLTHYFAGLVILPEAAWLLLAARSKRDVALASLAPLVTIAALVPLAIDQRDHAGGGETEVTALGTRIAQVPKQFLVGFNVPLEIVLTVAGGVLVAVGIWMLAARAEPHERDGARIAGVIAVSGAALLLLLAAVGYDYLLTRYLTVILVPCAIVLGSGFSAARAGLLAAGALGLVFAAALVGVQADPAAQRPDLRGALEPLGPAPGGRAVYITSMSHVEAYLRDAQRLPAGGHEVREAVVIGLRVVGSDIRDNPDAGIEPPPAFKLVERDETDSYVRSTYRAPRPARVSPLELLGRESKVPITLVYEPR
jgi:hypothetical protein